MILPGRVCCECGAADLIAVEPGREPEFSGHPLLLALDRGEPERAWCAQCWPHRPKTQAA